MMKMMVQFNNNNNIYTKNQRIEEYEAAHRERMSLRIMRGARFGEDALKCECCWTRAVVCEISHAS